MDSYVVVPGRASHERSSPRTSSPEVVSLWGFEFLDVSVGKADKSDLLKAGFILLHPGSEITCA